MSLCGGSKCLCKPGLDGNLGFHAQLGYGIVILHGRTVCVSCIVVGVDVCILLHGWSEVLGWASSTCSLDGFQWQSLMPCLH